VNLRETLRQAEGQIASKDIPDARIEAELLLMHSLGIGKVELYASPEREVSPSELEHFYQLLWRRLQHEPAAYILGESQFYGVDLHVNPHVLIPRPESELLVELTLEYANEHPSKAPISVADVGTGSGAIAMAIALHIPQAEIYATDVSQAALQIARSNCQRYGLQSRVHLLRGDLLQPLQWRMNVIVANLPYVESRNLPNLPPEIRHFEPLAALAGGSDGLHHIGRLLAQAGQKLLPEGMLLVEIGQGQAAAATALARSHFPTGQIDLVPDLAGIDRVLRVRT